MRLFELMQADDGIGGTPNNANVDYMGKRVNMQAKTFLRLAAYLSNDATKQTSVEFLRKAIDENQPIAPPFLTIDIPDGWEKGDFSQPAKVEGHEGRHRCKVISEVEGPDTVIEVHLFFPGLRARHVTDEWMAALNRSLIPEGSHLTKPINGPFFVG